MKVYVQKIMAIVDTVSTISAVAKGLVPDGSLRKSEAMPLQINPSKYSFLLGIFEKSKDSQENISLYCG